MAKGKADPPPRSVPLRAPGKLGDELALEDDEPRTSVGQAPFAPDEFVDDLITNPGAPAALEVGPSAGLDPFEDLTPPPSIPPPSRTASTGGSLVLPIPAPPSAPAVADRPPPRAEGFLAPGKAPFQDAAQRLAAAGAAKIAGAKKHRIIAVAAAGPDWTWARLREIAIGLLLIGLLGSALWVKGAQPVTKQRPKVLLLDEAKRPLVVRSWKDLYLAQQNAVSSTVSGAAVPLEGSGTLGVFSVPGGAQVFVDRVYRGETPLVLPGGRSVVEVRVQLNGFTTWTGMVSPDDNGHATVNAVLNRR